MLNLISRLNFPWASQAALAAERCPVARLKSSLQSFTVDGVHYVARPTNNFLAGNTSNQTSFATVFSVSPGDVVSVASLRQQIAHMAEVDDVFNEHFLEGIIFQGATQSEVTVHVTPSEILHEWGVGWTHFHSAQDSQKASLPLGPYVIHNGELSQVWRLYSDDNLTFLQSVWPVIGSSSAYTNVPFSGTGHRTLSIAVPSRLQASWPKPRPLEGLRIGVKDLYHLEGVKTSLSNRAFNELYPAQSKTASTISHLISKGAHIVGKNHLSSFALMEHPTQSVDYEAPFNPRADGYQIPGGSSSGSASAIASYGWLDFSIATDATGSVRIPALWNGCFGLRPSTGTISTEGLVSVYPGFDTPGLFGRDLAQFENFVWNWYAEGIENKPLDSPRIVVPSDCFGNMTGHQLELIENFVRDLEGSLKTKAQRLSIADTWKDSTPVDERDLNIYLANATLHSYYYAAFHAFDDFREAYKTKYNRAPFITESNRWIWKLGSEVALEQRDDMNYRIQTFRSWFLKHYMKSDSQDTIIVLPIAEVMPNYRDAYPLQTKDKATPGLRTTYLSPYIGAPELVVPIGHLPFESRISGNTESLPVAVAVMGPPGSDMALVKLVLESLRASKRPTAVSTGTARMWAYEDESGSY